MTDLDIAYHEAAHAIVGAVLGRRVDAIELRPEPRVGGWVVWQGIDESRVPSLEDELAIAMAGVIVDEATGRRAGGRAYHADQAAVSRALAARRLTVPRHLRRARLAKAADRAREILSDHADVVCELARRLEREGRLEGHTVHHAIQNTRRR